MIAKVPRIAALAALLALPATVATANAEPAKSIVIVPRPADNPAITTDVRPQQLGAKVLYVNFDGGQLNGCGNNNPQQNCTTIYDGVVLPYSGDAANRAAVIQVVRKRVEEFGLTITDQRPNSGDYDMEMVGNWEGQNPGFAGIAPGGDCWDNDGGETSFTLEVSTSSDAIAEIMLQELAHTWGLDHVDEQQDLLYPTTEGTNKTFRDECYQIVSDTDLTPDSGFCSHHQQACGSNSQQNSHDEMMLIFGPSQPDTQVPIVAILAPGNGDVIDGAAFDLIIGLQDDQRPAVMNTTITIDGPSLPEPVEADGAFASPVDDLKFPIEGLPDGEYTIRLDAFDESDNPASDEITIEIINSDVEPAEDDGSDESGSADESGGTDADGGDEDDDDGNDDDDDDGGTGVGTGDVGATGGRGTDEGCQCVSQPAPAGALAWALLAIPALARRRRRAC